MKLFFIILLIALSGCEFFRKTRSQTYSTADLSKQTDSVKKSDSSVTRKQSEYEKTTFVFPVNKDSTIINNYFPDYPALPRPTVIIQEKGSAQEQTNTFNYEAWFRWKIDSLASTQKKTETTTKATLLGFWQIFAIGAVGIFALIFWLKK